MSKDKTHDEPIIVHSLDDIPHFTNEDEEREWWATHDLAPELWKPLSEEGSQRFEKWRSRAAQRRKQVARK